MERKRKKLYWMCIECGDVFTTNHGSIPLKCKECGGHVRGIFKSGYEFLKHHDPAKFENYQFRNNDYSYGAYGRWMAKQHNLPIVPENSPLNVKEICEEAGIL